jgi:hypothetical protein
MGLIVTSVCQLSSIRNRALQHSRLNDIISGSHGHRSSSSDTASGRNDIISDSRSRRNDIISGSHDHRSGSSDTISDSVSRRNEIISGSHSRRNDIISGSHGHRSGSSDTISDSASDSASRWNDSASHWNDSASPRNDSASLWNDSASRWNDRSHIKHLLGHMHDFICNVQHPTHFGRLCNRNAGLVLQVVLLSHVDVVWRGIVTRLPGQ